jgi:hypothetical protein
MQEKRLPNLIALRFTPGSAAVRSGVAHVRNIVLNYYRARRLHIATSFLLLIYAITVTLLILSCGGCANPVGLGRGGPRPDIAGNKPAHLTETMGGDDPDTSRVQDNLTEAQNAIAALLPNNFLLMEAEPAETPIHWTASRRGS